MNKIIFPLKLRMRGDSVANLQDGLRLLLEKGIIQLNEADRRAVDERMRAEIDKKTYGPATSELVGLFQKQNHFEPSRTVDEATANALNALLKRLGIFDEPVDLDHPIYMVQGRVVSRISAGISGLRVVIVDKGIGGEVQLAQTTTNDAGKFQVTFSGSDLRRGKAQPDLQARVFAGDVFLGASDVRYYASPFETLNVMLDDTTASALRSEHEALTTALAGQFSGTLRDLKESGEQQDITYLANKTGWDARAVALAALADQFSARTMDAAGAGVIPQAFFYALFRAGLPANEDTLYHTDPKTLEALWKKAAEQGVISKTSVDRIPNLIKRFQSLSTQKLLTGPALVGLSSLKEMLSISHLNEAQQAKFAQLYATNRTDGTTFWKAVGDALGLDVAQRLQVDGKLGYLTINNAPLMRKVHAIAGANGLSDPLQLAQMGYHRAEPWRQLLAADIPIPKEIPGDTPESKRANYASYLAAHVRLSYPTAAVVQMIKSGELPLTGAAPGVSDQVQAFLTQHHGKFEISVQPVQQYILQNNLKAADVIVQQVKRLQRVYQITPSDQAMAGLLKRGIDAAYQVARYDRGTFVQSFAKDLGGVDQAERTYDKSVQIHSAVIQIALSYLSARTAPAVGVHSPPSIVDPTPASASDVIAYATLESLFGSMDFCACVHCRSILSPAAYLVDLLLFLHADEEVWKDFCTVWRSEHDGAPYPFPNQAAFVAANQPQNTEVSPLSVFLSRRPDIEHLPLTCENTNTALPYIDVVNETLEYFIANTSQKLSLNDYHGHNTIGVASEDLLASPQFVMDSAYTTLRGERFPAPLPYHQPLENLRRYFNKFEVPLPLAMERLRKTDDLERGANPYGWRDILMEDIGLSRAEYETLTDFTAVPLWRMYGFPNGTADADVVAGLSNARQFAKRVGISYEELVAILGTRFVNPNSNLIPKLERLGVTFAMLTELKTKNDAQTDAKFDAFLASLAVPPDPAEYGGDIKAWVKDNTNYNRIMGLITLAIPADTWAASKSYAVGDCVRPSAPPTGSTLFYECTTAGTSAPAEPKWPAAPGETYTDETVVWTCRDASSCHSFDNLAFRHSDPAKIAQNIDTVDFVRLLRFIRLWKKLGWAIESTDAAICALFRSDNAPLNASDIDTVVKLDEGFLRLLPGLGIAVRVMNALNLTVKRDIPSLLTCLSEIGTHGNSALYRQMFLNPALLEQDADFADNGYGDFLTDHTLKLTDHAEALRSAFNLTGDEYDHIVAALGYDANTVLTVPNVSAIFRRGWLARKLKLSVRELLLLIRLTGLDPFAAPDPTNTAIWRLIKLVQSMKDRSFKSAVALYLIWNQDLSGKSAPDATQVASFARTLRLAFASVASEFAVADDPDGAIAQTRMTMVYGVDTAAFFFALLNNTLTVEIEFSDPDGTLSPGATWQAIENAAGKTDAGVPRIVYDDFRKRLSYSGVLTTATRDAIKLAAGGGAAAFKTAVDDLYDENQAVINPFFARYPELQPFYNAYVADTIHSPAEKRTILLAALLPELVQRRKRQQALQSVSAIVNTELTFAQVFLDPPATPLPLHAVGQGGQPALNDLIALETLGLSVQFFASDTATGAILPVSDIASNLDYAPTVGGTGNPLPAHPTPGAAVSGVWRGYLETPESGFFKLHIEADAGATVTLQLDDKPIALTQNAALWNNTNPIELRVGTLYPIRLTVERVREVVRVSWDWQPKGQGRSVIPARFLYPAVLFQRFQETYVRFLKAASLAAGLGLTANELAYLATHADYHIAGDGWLNALSVNGDPTPATAATLIKPLEALLGFARIKTDISPSDESLLTILNDPPAATQSPESLLFTITRWNQTSLNDVLGHFGGNITALQHFDLFRRVYDAFALVQKMGIPANALIQATTNEPAAHTVRDTQAALRARYDAASWREVVRPINDEMRGLQRDALLAYILHQMRSHPASAHIDTPDKLFEYFLMDVQMDPCMQTSRIRHALSSVQLFIERCLMNLEPRVSPAAINAKLWTWMKRYRVWEANRKVYLFPENWLEPELRDDQSPFFKETMSELLQSDISEERAATALGNYLSKLEDVAKLEPCGIFHIPADAAKRTGETNHVVARTSGALRKYYCRRYELGYWTPWEQIKLDIEDNPVIPVVWKDRLLLFWLRILDTRPDTTSRPPANKAITNLNTNDIPGDPDVKVQALLCWSEYYNGKWQPAKTSDVNKPFALGSYKVTGTGTFSRSSLVLQTQEVSIDGFALSIICVGGETPASILIYNTHSLPVGSDLSPRIDPRYPDTSDEHFIIVYNDLAHGYFDTPEDLDGAMYVIPQITRHLITEPFKYRCTQPQHELNNSAAWIAPFFLEDSRHVFYVTSIDEQVWLPDYRKYGVGIFPDYGKVTKIPPLILKVDPEVQLKPKPWGDGGPIGPDPGIFDPSPMRRFVTEDVYIRHGIGTRGTVVYGRKRIGPSGAIRKSRTTR